MTPNNFLGLPAPQSDFATAQVLVLPIPFEATVSYGHGTAQGPAAIIAASQQVELYDREFDDEPALRYGIHTLPALDLPDDPAQAVPQIATAVGDAARSGKLVVGLGGEHTISVAFGRGLLDAGAPNGHLPLTVVQIDAHSDLRYEYEASPYSHACIARRLLEDERIEQVLQLGIRSVCTEEVAFARANPERVRVWYAEEVHRDAWREELISRLLGRRVYLTIDVDGLDPAIVPATGTPEPDGLTWVETLDILRTVAQAAPIVGIDCVELAPHPGQHAAEFAVAKLLYKTITYAVGTKPNA
jgi:agmatinase